MPVNRHPEVRVDFAVIASRDSTGGPMHALATIWLITLSLKLPMVDSVKLRLLIHVRLRLLRTRVIQAVPVSQSSRTLTSYGKR